MSSRSSIHRGDAVDVAVIGNGVLGLSLAITLARSSLSVVLIGPGVRPRAASTAAGAMLGCFGEVTAPQLRSEHGRKRLALDLTARDAWPGWIEFLADAHPMLEPILTASGTTVLLNAVGTEDVDSANFLAIESALKEHGEPYEQIDPVDVEWIAPEPTSRPLRAIHIPGEHAVNVGVLMEALEGAAQSLGVRFIDAEAQSIEVGSERVDGVLLKDGESVSAGTVVIAAGAHSQDLIDTVPAIKDRIPPVVAGHGVSVLLGVADGQTPTSVIRTPNRAFACGLHVVPRDGSTVYVGATNMINDAPVDEPQLRDVVTILERAYTQLKADLHFSRVRRVQSGNRPVTLDGNPLLGETSIDGLWLMTGTYRDGLFMSPTLAEDLASRIIGGSGTVDISAFTPERRPLEMGTREEILQITLDQMMAVGYEEPWRIAPLWDGLLKELLAHSHQSFADELDGQFTPPPEILLAALGSPHVRRSLRSYYAAVRSASDL